ncbi:universal stress protein [Corallococcus coralloides]|nr:universal stress protein [Corallococcus coralloides]
MMVEAGHARSALERASLLDLAPGARVAVLVRQGAELQGEPLARAEERLAARLQAVGGTLSRVEPAMDEDLMEAFERQAAQDAPELVIVAREPRGRLARLLGDTPEKLARHGRGPVLVTRLPAEAPYRRVLVGIDFSENAREALELALRLTPPEAGPLDVLHCYDTRYALVMRQEGASAKQMVDYYRRRASEADAGLRAFLQPYRDQGTDLQPLVRSGDPQAELEHAVREQETELLVVGKHGGHGLMHALLGSVAEACLRRAECDVLVVPQAVAQH